jgi:hypothetical protein
MLNPQDVIMGQVHGDSDPVHHASDLRESASREAASAPCVPCCSPGPVPRAGSGSMM